MKRATKISVVAIVSLTACVEQSVPVGQPAVGSSSDLSAFEGARAGQAEMGIQNLGYELIRTEGLTVFWFNRSTGACARIMTSEGRYSDVTMLPSGDC
ncbi:hypothetical protein [Marivita hallyeonensis]|uniref:Uncharacterized protein n=1 Tax=Marivita hallyeonensis TaxID=996342 RepID=A0A1M5MXF0_9RHOB|nr:hypothetical protein [Marivita hallyeonensis]SHG81895.1 hypothetical protein SAMN05443551_0690 [Marivita hallyeonensis]